jgi:hypothetical protein
MEIRITSRGSLYAHLPIEVFQACDPWHGAEIHNPVAYVALEKNFNRPRDYVALISTRSDWNAKYSNILVI